MKRLWRGLALVAIPAFLAGCSKVEYPESCVTFFEALEKASPDIVDNLRRDLVAGQVINMTQGSFLSGQLGIKAADLEGLSPWERFQKIYDKNLEILSDSPKVEVAKMSAGYGRLCEAGMNRLNSGRLGSQ